jgi:hypothetical protein
MGRAADRIGPWGTLVAKWERSTHVSGGGGTECTQWDWGSERERTRGSERENDVPFFILSSFFLAVEIVKASDLRLPQACYEMRSRSAHDALELFTTECQHNTYVRHGAARAVKEIKRVPRARR